FPGDPDNTTPGWVFGRESLPAAPTHADATKVTWYSREANTNVIPIMEIYLREFTTDGTNAWYFTPPFGVGSAESYNMPMDEACVITIPDGSSRRSVLFTARVPTNIPPDFISGDVTPSVFHHSLFAGMKQPQFTHPNDFGFEPGPAALTNGFKGHTVPIPSLVDFMWKWDREQQRVLPGHLIWFNTADSTWRFAKPGYPVVPSDYFSPCDAILFQRNALGAGPMMQPIVPIQLYPSPTKEMTP
ncbi:MAG: hypothetical protein AAF492_05795, partial [Verrucomicrobiota bacterium]